MTCEEKLKELEIKIKILRRQRDKALEIARLADLRFETLKAQRDFWIDKECFDPETTKEEMDRALEKLK